MDFKKLTRDEWLIARDEHVSSTESSALFGMSPYGTAYELAVTKQGRAEQIDDNERMRWGRRLQDSIAQGLADDYSVVIEGLEYVYAQHPTEPRMGASFDYRIVEAQGDSPLATLFAQHGPGLLEIKNVDALQYRQWPEHDAPDHIEIQIQHQLEVARLEWCVLGVLVGGNRTEVYTRMRDGQVGQAIVTRIHEFWANLDKNILPPPVMPEDADLIIKLHQFAEPNKLFDGRADDGLMAMCLQYSDVAEQARLASQQQKVIKAEILKRIGDAERALVTGYTISASMVASAEVQAYTRGAYRNFRVTKKEAKHG